jgi:hypothetical protein
MLTMGEVGVLHLYIRRKTRLVPVRRLMGESSLYLTHNPQHKENNCTAGVTVSSPDVIITCVQEFSVARHFLNYR